MFEAQKNSSSAVGLEKSYCRFFCQYLGEDSDAKNWWQYVVTTDEKKNFEKIKARFTERYGNAIGGNMAARNQFEIQNESMSLRQKHKEGICDYCDGCNGEDRPRYTTDV